MISTDGDEADAKPNRKKPKGKQLLAGLLISLTFYLLKLADSSYPTHNFSFYLFYFI